jgi:hypothetical protein
VAVKDPAARRRREPDGHSDLPVLWHLAEDLLQVGESVAEASQQSGHHAELRHQLAAIEREHARFSEAIAIGTERIPVLVERLRAADLKRAELRHHLDRTRSAAPPKWREVEGRMQRRLTEVRSILSGDVARARQAFREGLLVIPIQFTPFVERGYRAIRFAGRWGLEAVFGGELVTNVASPSIPSWNQIAGFLESMRRLRDATGLVA